MPIGMSKGATTATEIKSWVVRFTSGNPQCFQDTYLVMFCDVWYQLKPEEVLILEGTGHQATGANSNHQGYGIKQF
jgi:hypothetical protein